MWPRTQESMAEDGSKRGAETRIDFPKIARVRQVTCVLPMLATSSRSSGALAETIEQRACARVLIRFPIFLVHKVD